jgi:hypothetical protein
MGEKRDGYGILDGRTRKKVITRKTNTSGG